MNWMMAGVVTNSSSWRFCVSWVVAPTCNPADQDVSRCVKAMFSLHSQPPVGTSWLMVAHGGSHSWPMILLLKIVEMLSLTSAAWTWLGDAARLPGSLQQPPEPRPWRTGARHRKASLALEIALAQR